ncbi:helix-turn-helix domain-containing protein [Hanstruepera ponticola]|uniref:helix-turn-helix domain-containing protein n=1 Tax=Hanstruepera ponticola TaxID=2042995 RepID=UPI00177D1C98|nr:AraC family transcriptional regulator [Hanstruepera ponticola]
MVNKLSQHHSQCVLYYKKLTLLLIGCLLSFNVFSQQDNLISKASELVYSNPDEAIKIAELILKTSQDSQDNAHARLLLAKSYLVKGAFNEAVINAFDDVSLLDDINVETQVEINIIKATLLRKLYLDKQSEYYLNQASEMLSKESIKAQDSLHSNIALERINMLIDRRNSTEALAVINKTEAQFKSFFESNKHKKQSLYIAKERAFSDLTQYDSAFVYINKIFSVKDSTQVTNLYERAMLYKELGYLHLQKKEFDKSEKNFFIALRFAEILGNDNLLLQINRELAINYLASGQKSQHKVYNDVFLLLNNEVELMEQEAVNTVYNLITKQHENWVSSEKDIYQRYQNLLLAGILFIIVVCVFFILTSQARKKRIKEIISYLEISKSNLIKTKPTKKSSKRRIAIPEETEKNLLDKLKRFEKSKQFLNNDMSLALLAGKFETNTKYLSEIINRHYNDNFNTFINKLRIKHIIEKLKSDSNYMNYKISYLAEECGFTSHSSFATVFKSIVGMSPATFIGLIKEERKSLKKKENVE